MDQVYDVIHGEGYAAGHLDAMGEGYGFRKVRRALDVSAFGMNALVVPPGYGAGFHWHDEQEETYFVHAGVAELEFADGTSVRLGPGALARVDAATHRRLSNAGDEDLVVLVVGGKDGYVGRDGRAPENEPRVRRT